MCVSRQWYWTHDCHLELVCLEPDTPQCRGGIHVAEVWLGSCPEECILEFGHGFVCLQMASSRVCHLQGRTATEAIVKWDGVHCICFTEGSVMNVLWIRSRSRTAELHPFVSPSNLRSPPIEFCKPSTMVYCVSISIRHNFRTITPCGFLCRPTGCFLLEIESLHPAVQFFLRKMIESVLASCRIFQCSAQIFAENSFTGKWAKQ